MEHPLSIPLSTAIAKEVCSTAIAFVLSATVLVLLLERILAGAILRVLRNVHSVEQFPSSDYEQEHEHEFNEF